MPRRLLTAIILLAALPAGAAALTSEETLGKRIYVEGRGVGGRDIPAAVGKSSLRLDASVVPCAGCHGRDGQGRPEGGVAPPRITWEELAKPYGHRHDDGRSHPPFDEAALAMAVTVGKDPAGNSLDAAMPRYGLSGEETQALAAYLKRLQSDLDPGIGEDRLLLGTVLPRTGRLAGAGLAMKRVLEAVFSDVNAGGGVFGRRLELAVVAADDGAVARLQALDPPPFALLATFSGAAEQDLAAYAKGERIPSIGAFTLFTDAGDGGGRSFFLWSGLSEQGRALARYAVENLNLRGLPAAVVHPPGEGQRRAARAVVREAEALGWRITPLEYADGGAGSVAASLARQGTAAVFFLGWPADLQAFAAVAGRAGWAPRLLLPAASAAGAEEALPPALASRAWVAYPLLPQDEKPEAVQRFAELRARHGLPEEHLLAQTAAYVAAQTLVEALKRSGRDLSRERLVSALESLYDFDSGLTPLLRFGPQRHIGAWGAHILPLRPPAQPQHPAWVRLD